MTERFNINPSMMVTGKYVIIDELRQYTFPVLEPTMNHMFCKALNELNNDREHLKQSHKEILRDLEVTTFDKELLQKEKEWLYKENKQLKMHMKSVKAHLEGGHTKKAIERLKIIDIR